MATTVVEDPSSQRNQFNWDSKKYNVNQMHTWTTTYYNEVIKTGYLIGTWFRQQMNQDSFLFNCIMQSALESQSTWS